MDKVLAIMFSGSCKPTAADYKRALLLVRRNVVAEAIRWLILNHVDYSDVTFSSENLAGYSEDAPIVAVEYFKKGATKNAEGVSIHDPVHEDGSNSGDCVFAVYGIVGEATKNMKLEQLRGIALQHLDSEGKFMRTSHAAQPESIWNNERLYAKMFPWLFPYGLGAVGMLGSELSSEAHKKYLLMYHDKRFQTDLTFPFVAFSHEQVQKATQQSYLLADRKSFQQITDRFLALDQKTLSDLASRLANGEYVKAESDEQKQCFAVLKDIDSASRGVNGSITSKKYMQSELWSLVTFLGAPSWYITLAPCDFKHPLCILFADDQHQYEVPLPLRSADDRRRLIGQNPVACARFFHFMITLFLEHVVGNKDSDATLFGPSSGYYCTVEEQGHTTLHMHGVIHLLNSLTPQEIKERLLDSSSTFQKRLIAYLESIRIGEFVTGPLQSVRERVTEAELQTSYVSPELTLPLAPPAQCGNDDNGNMSNEYIDWLQNYQFTVDDLLTKSNVHNCLRTWNKDGSLNLDKWSTSCLNNPRKSCKGRFPRPTYPISSVDPETGHLDLKKLELNINDILPSLTYLFRGNTDVTCLLTGTSVKAVILYVSDYITKLGLKTHVIFDTIRSVFEKNTEIVNGTLENKHKARQLITKVVNLLATKLELGSPLIPLYLLGNPDHYTSHHFVTLYWSSFVTEARRYWYPDDIQPHDRLILIKPVALPMLAAVPDSSHAHPSNEAIKLAASLHPIPLLQHLSHSIYFTGSSSSQIFMTTTASESPI